MTTIWALAAAAVSLSVLMAAAWVAVLRTGHGGWADTVWTFSTGAAALLAIVLAGGSDADPTFTGREMLAAGLAAAWSGRLGFYLLGRTWTGPEDQRYADLRREWGADHPRRLFWFLQAQAAAAVVLVVAIVLAAHRPGPLDAFDALGVVLFVTGVIGAGVADRQLAAFKANPQNRGRVCDTGLWARSRHPNYFFEWVGWLAWPVLGFDPSFASWGWVVAAAAPAMMYYLLVFVSGVPPLEAHMARTRPEAWARYVARTPVFFPKWRSD